MVKKLVYAGMLCSALLWWGCSQTEPDKAITVEVDLNAGNDTDSIEDIFAVERLIPLQAGGMVSSVDKLYKQDSLIYVLDQGQKTLFVFNEEGQQRLILKRKGWTPGKRSSLDDFAIDPEGNIYLFDASIRVEGSSEFGADEKCGTFWSTGVGLNLHNYEAISDLGFFDLLKLRGSYGQTGAVNFAPYQAETTYQIFTDEWYKTGYGATLYALGNEALRWETTNTLDVGFEVSFLRRLFYLKASYYVKRTTDMVNDVTIPSHTGFTTYKDNVGEVENRGFELDFRSDIFRNRDWYVSIFANLAHNRNKILKISDSLRDYNKQVQDYYSDPFNQSSRSQPLLQYVEGGSMNSIWGIRSLGIDPASGKELFLRPDGTVTDTWRSGDQVVIGNKEPDGQGTFGFSASWRNFSLYTTFMYEFGGQRYNQTLVDKVEDADIYDSNVDYRVLTDRWQKPGDVSKFQALQAGVNNIAQTQPTSRFVQDYNYLTLNSLSLEYTFDNELIAPWGLSMLRLELSANDLFYASTVKQERGLSYPYSRSVSFAVKASF